MSREDRGQALVVLVALLGFAALVVTSLSAADTRLLGRLRALRAAEAAAEAAGAAVADALVELRDDDLAQRRQRDVIDVALADPLLRGHAVLATRPVLDALGAELSSLSLARRVDELSVRAEVRLGGVSGTARVGVRPP
jgi:hypothetical protein